MGPIPRGLVDRGTEDTKRIENKRITNVFRFDNSLHNINVLGINKRTPVPETVVVSRRRRQTND